MFLHPSNNCLDLIISINLETVPEKKIKYRLLFLEIVNPVRVSHAERTTTAPRNISVVPSSRSSGQERHLIVVPPASQETDTAGRDLVLRGKGKWKRNGMHSAQ